MYETLDRTKKKKERKNAVSGNRRSAPISSCALNHVLPVWDSVGGGSFKAVSFLSVFTAMVDSVNTQFCHNIIPTRRHARIWAVQVSPTRGSIWLGDEPPPNCLTFPRLYVTLWHGLRSFTMLCTGVSKYIMFPNLQRCSGSMQSLVFYICPSWLTPELLVLIMVTNAK